MKPFHDPRDPARLTAVLNNKRSNLFEAEERLKSANRETVEILGALKRSESALKKLGCNPSLESRIEELRNDLAHYKKVEETASGIVKMWHNDIDTFLKEGDPTNEEMIRAAKELDHNLHEAGLV